MGSLVGVTTAPQGIFRSRAVASNRQSENSGRGEVTRREESEAHVLTGPLLEAIKEQTALTSICSARAAGLIEAHQARSRSHQLLDASGLPEEPVHHTNEGTRAPHATQGQTQGTAHGPASPCSSLSDLCSPRSRTSSSSIQPADSHRIRPHELERHHTRLTASQRARDQKASLSGVESVLVMCRP